MRTDVADLDMPAVEREITTLAGHLAAGTCRFLELLAAFDAGGGWHGAGMRTCAQWLSWRCGLSTGAAREQLRVARALGELPGVREAFRGGRISFSKARALTRVATADTEDDLLDAALACTASQLDRLCSGIARARTSAEVVEQAARASFSARWETDGTLRFSGRLSAEDGTALLAALAAVRPDAVADPMVGTVDVPEADRADTTPSSGPAGSEGSPDAACEAARSDAAALVLLARHAMSTPPPAVGSGPVRLVIHTSAEVLDLADTSAEVPELRGGAISAEVPDEASQPTSAEVFAVPSVAVLDAGPGIPLLPLGPETLRRLACEAIVEQATNPDAEPSRRVEHRFATARQRRALLRRDGGCVFPGCPRRRGLHAHHLIPWHQGGPTAMHNLLLLCEHHHLLIHEGGWQLRSGPDQRWQAVCSDGRILSSAPGCDGRDDLLPGAHDAAIEQSTVAGSWNGDPLQLDYAVAVYAAVPDPRCPSGAPSDVAALRPVRSRRRSSC